LIAVAPAQRHHHICSEPRQADLKTPSAVFAAARLHGGVIKGEISMKTKGACYTVVDTGHIDGGAYRLVELADGSARVEGWTAKGWVPGGASIEEMMDSPPVGAAFAARLGIPPSDLRHDAPHGTPRRHFPNLTKLSKTDLRQAIELGTRLAEEEALFKLAMKAKQVAELDRRRPRLVVDNTKL
jgi:hypothetical protein